MSAPGPRELAEALAPVLGEGLRVEGIRRAGGGTSRAIWAFDALLAGGERRALVLRMDAPEVPGLSDAAPEADLLRAAARAGVPVPRVHARLEDAPGVGTGTVMDRVEGETIPRRILREDAYRDARRRMAAQCGEILAGIHSIDPASVPGLPGAGDEERPAAREVRRLRELIDRLGEPHPAFELALRWLGERLPATGRTSVVHGDFRNGNLVVGEEGIRAVLDWELAHAGDGLEDLGWLCVLAWRHGRDELPVGGFGTREDLYRAYEAAGGGAVDPAAVRFWEVFGNLRWGVICVLQASFHLLGVKRSVELAAIGRRACEVEHEILRLIEEAA